MKRSIIMTVTVAFIAGFSWGAYAIPFQNALSSTLPVVSTKSTVIFPHQFAPIHINATEDGSRLRAMRQVVDNKEELVLLLASKPSLLQSFSSFSVFESSELQEVGTIAAVKYISVSPSGDVDMLVEGISRARATNFFFKKGSLYAQIDHIAYKEQTAKDELAALMTLVKSDVSDLTSLQEVLRTQRPEKIVELLIAGYQLGAEESQSLLECTSTSKLLIKLHEILSLKIDRGSVKKHIEGEAYKSISESNKRFILEQQMKAIKKELGDGKSHTLAQKLAALPLPEEVRTEVDRKLSRLEILSPEHPDAEVIQTYLDWISKLPWGKETADNLDIAHAKKILDEDHYGLKDIKERILDYIAVRCLSAKNTGVIICLVGPPGVGKTSLVRSIARSLGRQYSRMSLGGLHDEAEIRGHRSTYIGALPGRLIQTMKRAESMNPVILLDEIDKMGRDYKGDPSAALLEVLDPEQNRAFYDNYLAVPFDLSKVLFVATANSIDSIPQPLFDRMEVIHLSGYSLEEKLNIAQNYLVKKAYEHTGLETRPLNFSRELLTDIILHYTRESGVRELERLIKKLCSKAARSWVETKQHITITSDNIEKYLGPRLIKEDSIEEMTQRQIGITNGLAWTAHGGELLKIEAVIMPGKGKLTLTGSLGEVMRESAQAAMSYARAHADEFGIDAKRFTDFDLHVHVPSGAVPKDGPSAGVTMLSSILSALTGRAIDGSYAMTGELNLRGQVMPIGGVKEKVLAAKRSGMHHVLLPEKNRNDLVGEDDVTKGIDIIYVSHANEVLSRVLLKP